MTRRRFSASALMAHLEGFRKECVSCGIQVGGAAGLEWDHRVPLALGGEDELENLEPLCKGCHRAKTKRDKGHIAKAKRMQQRDAGIRRQSRSSFQTNRDGPFRHKINGEVERR